MKKLLVAATMAASVSVWVIPAFAQSATTVQAGFTMSRNDTGATVHAENAAPARYRVAQSGNLGSRSGAPLWHHGQPWSPDNPYNYDNAGG